MGDILRHELLFYQLFSIKMPAILKDSANSNTLFLIFTLFKQVTMKGCSCSMLCILRRERIFHSDYPPNRNSQPRNTFRARRDTSN
ncbi:hypothetical protein PS15p_204456 [Mucor circinelloides]